MNETNEPTQNDEFMAAIDRVADAPVGPGFPHDPSQEFRAAAGELLKQIARIRYQADGGDLAELDELGVEDPNVTLDLDDLREFVAGFHADGNQRAYAACAAVFDWATSTRD